MKKYVFLKEYKALREVTWKEYEKIKKVKDRYQDSFKNIFKDKKRIMIPFSGGADDSAKDKVSIRNFVKFFNDNGYNLDFSTGLAEKEIEISDGPHKGEKKKKKMKIGGILQNAKDTKDKAVKSKENYDDIESNKQYDNLVRIFPQSWKHEDWPTILDKIEKFSEFWNKNSKYYRENPDAYEKEKQKEPYSIIISRSPIDILRMGDFPGYYNCHAPPSNTRGTHQYYKCAIADAQNNALVAYVVDNEDLPKDFDLEQDEIFEDDKRHIRGINALSRVIIRKYVDDDGNELAVPEKRSYGKDIPGFKQEVLKWLKENQKDEIENIKDSEKFNMKDYTLYGGSYRDSSDSDLFNRLVDTDEFSGNAPHEMDDSEEDDVSELYDNYQSECEDIQRRADRRMENSSVSFDVSQDDEYPYVSFGGTLKLEFNISDFKKDITIEEVIDAKVNQYLDVKGINFSDMEFRKEYHAINFYGQIYDDNGRYELNPQGFDEFCDMVESEYDDKSKKIKNIIYSAFESEKLMKEREFTKQKDILSDKNKIKDLFKNLEVITDTDEDSGEITFTLPESTYIEVEYPNALQTIVGVRDYFLTEDYRQPLLDNLYDDYEKYQANIDKQLQLPFGEAINRKKLLSKDDINLKISSINEERYVAKLEFGFNIDTDTSNDKVKDMIKFAYYLDKKIENNGLQPIFQKTANDKAKKLGYRLGKEKELKLDLEKTLEEKLKDSNYDGMMDTFKLTLGEVPYNRLTKVKVSYQLLNNDTEFKIVYINTDIGTAVVNYFDHKRQEDFLINYWYPTVFKDIKHNIQTTIVSLVVNEDLFEPGTIAVVGDSLEKYLKQNNFKQKKNENEIIYYMEKNQIKENKIMFETDMDLENYINDILKNQEALELVKNMQQQDVIKVINITLDIQPQDVNRIALGLIQKVKESCYIPADDRPDKVIFKSFTKMRDNKKIKNKEKIEENPGNPMGKSDMTPRFDIKRWQFPPDPVGEEPEWPYNSFTVQAMDIKNKGKKKGFMR